MFVLEMISDTITVPASALSVQTVTSIHHAIDAKYPNRVLMDVGLVIGRYEEKSNDDGGDNNKKYATRVGHGVCVGSDTHYPCQFPLIVFRPFVNEVLVGTILESSEAGVTVSIGFFSAIHIPAYWMLNPSKYEESSGLWVWVPQYDDEDEEEDEKEEERVPKNIVVTDNGNETPPKETTDTADSVDNNTTRYEMELGAEIRFRVKSIHFTQVTATAKGMQALTNATGSFNRSDETAAAAAASSMFPPPLPSQPVRKRSTSLTLNDSEKVPSAMHIVASICEDGLGLTSWWKDEEDDEEDEEEEES